MEEKNGFVNAYLRGKSQETEKDKGVGGGGGRTTQTFVIIAATLDCACHSFGFCNALLLRLLNCATLKFC